MITDIVKDVLALSSLVGVVWAVMLWSTIFTGAVA